MGSALDGFDLSRLGFIWPGGSEGQGQSGGGAGGAGTGQGGGEGAGGGSGTGGGGAAGEGGGGGQSGEGEGGGAGAGGGGSGSAAAKRDPQVPEEFRNEPPEVQAKIVEAIRNVSGEAGKNRYALRAAEKARDEALAKVKEHETAQMSEMEKRDARIKELEESNAGLSTKLQVATIGAKVRDTATLLGFRDPGDAFAMLDRARLTVNDEGEPENADELLRELAGKKPYLLRAPGSADGGESGGGGSSSPRTMDEIIRAGVGKVKT